MKCQIQWIDELGRPTPDDNESVGRVRTIERREWHGGRLLHFPASGWYAICACHAAQLNKPGMHIWVFEPYEVKALFDQMTEAPKCE